MKIIKLKGGKVEVICENEIEKTFWNNIRTALSQSDITIKTLTKERNGLYAEVSFLKKQLENQSPLNREENAKSPYSETQKFERLNLND